MQVYFFVMISLQNPANNFEIEEGIRGALFSSESDTVDIQGNIAEEVSSHKAIYTWLQSTFVDEVFIDPICGDSVCNPQIEFKGWEQSGCQSDCGKRSDLTEVVVEITADFASDEELASAEWDICSPDTEFGHNICRFRDSPMGHGKKVRREWRYCLCAVCCVLWHNV
jgi:hypothetical protein